MGVLSRGYGCEAGAGVVPQECSCDVSVGVLSRGYSCEAGAGVVPQECSCEVVWRVVPDSCELVTYCSLVF